MHTAADALQPLLHCMTATLQAFAAKRLGTEVRGSS